MTQDDTLTMSFQGEAADTIRTLAKELNKNPGEVVAGAVGLLKMVSGRKVILREPHKTQTYDVRDYEKNSVLVNIGHG